MALRDRLPRKIGRAFDKVWRKIEGERQFTISLLKPSDVANEFITVAELEGEWFFAFTNNRQHVDLEVADTDSTLEDNVPESTHIDLGPYGVYVINKEDTITPASDEFTWKISADRFTKRGQFSSLY